MNSPSPAQIAAQVADRLRAEWIDQPFGIVRFWRFAVVRPNDQSYLVTAVDLVGERLDLTYVHESRRGTPALLSVWAPGGLGVLPADQGHGIVLQTAQRLRFEQAEAWRDGDAYRIRTPRGEGEFPISGAPALTLAR